MKHAIDPLVPIRPQLHAIGLDEHLGHKITALYRFFADDGALLYVGVTRNPLPRWQSHSRRASWWPLVALVAVEWHPYPNAATDAEYAAIRAERPLFNIHGAPQVLTTSSISSPNLLMSNVPLSLSRSLSESLSRRYLSLTFANADTREASHVSDRPPSRPTHRVTGQASTRSLG